MELGTSRDLTYTPGALDEADWYLAIECLVQVASSQEADSAEAAEGWGHLAPEWCATAVHAAVATAVPLAPPAQRALRRADAEVVCPQHPDIGEAWGLGHYG